MNTLNTNHPSRTPSAKGASQTSPGVALGWPGAPRWGLNATALCFLCALLFLPAAHAQPSATSISFQGVLNGAGGAPLPNSRYDLTFRFHTNATVGTAIATSTVPQVPVTNGVASTAIPVQPAWFDGGTRWLGITVAGQNGGNELAPRVLVTAVPYALATRGVAVNPPPRFIPPIALPRPSQRVVIGNTTEDISRIPPVEQALVIGTTNDAAGTSVGIYFDTASRADSAIIVEKNSEAGIEDNRMHFYVGKEGDFATRKALTINQNGNVGIGTPQQIYSRLVVGSSNGDADRMPACHEAMVIGTKDNAGAGTRVGLYFDTNERNGGGIIVEKMNDGANEDHRMHFYVTQEGALSRKAVTIAQNGAVGIGTDDPQSTLDVAGTARMTVCQITSDRHAKTAFHPVNPRAVLDKLAALPLTTWSYTNSPAIRHLGPVAQDFATAFALGEDDKHIATVDADGVLFASVQALHQLVWEKDAKIQNLEKRLEKLERLATLRQEDRK